MIDDLLTPKARAAVRAGIPVDELFTPIGPDRKRLFMRVKNRNMPRGPGFKGIVTDLLTGKRWKVYGKSCSLPNCYCDARVEPAE